MTELLKFRANQTARCVRALAQAFLGGVLMACSPSTGHETIRNGATALTVPSAYFVMPWREGDTSALLEARYPSLEPYPDRPGRGSEPPIPSDGIVILVTENHDVNTRELIERGLAGALYEQPDEVVTYDREQGLITRCDKEGGIASPLCSLQFDYNDDFDVKVTFESGNPAPHAEIRQRVVDLIDRFRVPSNESRTID